MEAPIVALIEKKFYEKIMLYNDLLHCFRQESESLINIDLDKLWVISKEKEEICANISTARHKIMTTVGMQGDQKSFDLNRIMELIPRECKAEFQKLYLRLIKLKSEIEILRKENMIFVNDSLQFLDEIMAVITGKSESGMMYNDKCHASKSGSHLFLNREV
jgi:hypothetical protein